jgi:hypothetical protein
MSKRESLKVGSLRKFRRSKSEISCLRVLNFSWTGLEGIGTGQRFKSILIHLVTNTIPFEGVYSD